MGRPRLTMRLPGFHGVANGPSPGRFRKSGRSGRLIFPRNGFPGKSSPVASEGAESRGRIRGGFSAPAPFARGHRKTPGRQCRKSPLCGGPRPVRPVRPAGGLGGPAIGPGLVDPPGERPLLRLAGPAPAEPAQQRSPADPGQLRGPGERMAGLDRRDDHPGRRLVPLGRPAHHGHRWSPSGGGCRDRPTVYQDHTEIWGSAAPVRSGRFWYDFGRFR